VFIFGITISAGFSAEEERAVTSEIAVVSAGASEVVSSVLRSSVRSVSSMISEAAVSAVSKVSENSCADVSQALSSVRLLSDREEADSVSESVSLSVSEDVSEKVSDCTEDSVTDSADEIFVSHTAVSDVTADVSVLSVTAAFPLSVQADRKSAHSTAASTALFIAITPFRIYIIRTDTLTQ